MSAHNSMARVVSAAWFIFAIILCAPPRVGFPHEGHQMQCSDASLNAMKADVQAMPDGNSKMAATREMKAAQETMQKKDMKACMAHMHNAMDAIAK